MLLRLRSLTLVLLLLMQLVQLVVFLILPSLNLALVLSSVLFWPIEQSSEGWKIILYMRFPSQFAPCLVSCCWSSSGSLTSRLLCCSSLRFSVMVPLWQYQRTEWNHLLYQTDRSWLRFFTIDIVLGSYLAMMIVIFFWVAYKTDFFPWVFHVSTIERITHEDFWKLATAIYLQVNTVSQALIFVTRSWSWSYVECPGLLLVEAFLVAQLVATLIAVHANWSFAVIEGIGWSRAGVIWLNNIIFSIPLDFIKFIILYALSEKAWDLIIEQRIAFTRQKDFGKEAREPKWAIHPTWYSSFLFISWFPCYICQSMGSDKQEYWPIW